MFQEFPYTDMHQLNLDWIVKIAKAFLDQYTHIQQLIEDGEQSLQDLTAQDLQQLQDKADNLELLLQQWYDTHSADIANQLADALSDLNAWYSEHQAFLNTYVTNSIAAFNTAADAKASETIASIPDNYTNLSDSVLKLKSENTLGFGGENFVDLTRAHLTANYTDRIWFRPFEKYGKHIYKITYFALRGTINFYKVTYNPLDLTTFSYTLLYSFYNSSIEDGIIKTVDVDINMSENEYIGINGVFAYINHETNGSVTRNYTIATQEMSNFDYQSLLFNVSSTDSVLYKTTEKISKIIRNLDSDTLGGTFFENLKPASYLRANLTTMLWFRYDEVFPNKVNKIRYIALPGTTYFYKVHWVPGTTTVTYTQITSIVNTSAEDGIIKEIDVSVDLGEFDYIGINGAFGYINAPANGHKTRNYTIATGTLSGEDAQALLFNAYNSESLGAKIQALEEKTADTIEIVRHGEVQLYDALLLSSNPDIIGTQNFVTYGMTIDDTKILNKYYSISNRTIRYVCKFNANTVAQFGTVVKSGNTYSNNTTINVDIPNQTVKVGSLAAKGCPILNGTDEFIIEITKYYQVLQVNIIDTYTGDSQTFTFVTNGTGGVGAGATGTGVYPGMQHDYYFMTLLGGSAYHVRQIVIVCGKCDLVMYGDSITEPEDYYPTEFFPQSWTQRVIDKMNGRAMSSGRISTTINQLLDRIVNELPLIKPKYCMITIGTNGGNTIENLTQLVQYIKSQNVIPILNHIPCYNNNGDTTGFIAVNQLINTVRQAEQVKGCDFDLATSVNHDGLAVDTSKMWYEDYGSSTYYHHPNVKGSACMFARLLIDVPEIFE